MTSVCGYHCSICQLTLKTEKRWLNHLLSPNHQTEAREDFVSWDLQTKERVLVAFGKFSVATESVLGAFSDQNGKSTLSGFVWNEKRSRVGLLVFESREKMDGVLGSDMRIGSYQLLQLRRATDYLELEWEELIAPGFRSEFRMELKRELKTEMDDDKLPISKRIKVSHSDLSEVSSDEDESEYYEQEMKLEPAITIAPGESELDPFNFDLCSQWNLICSAVEIEDGVFNEALNIMEKCRRILMTRVKRCGLFMFRNWYLKLRGQWPNELIFYVDADGILASKSEATVGTAKKPTGDVMKTLFTSRNARRTFPELRYLQEKRMNGYLGFPAESIHSFEDMTAKIKFTLVTDPLYAVEAQTCRLLNYLLDFDPRARPFLTLIFYWAQQNEVAISGSSKMKEHLSYAFAPEPAGLEWMVIFFLCYKRILPSPRTILNRFPNPKVWYYLYNGKKYENDIGFRNDTQFAEECAASVGNCPPAASNEFFFHLVELGKEFFTFYGELRSTPQKWVLNTKDGELLRNEDLLEGDPNQFKTRLTKGELQLLRNPGIKLTKKQKNLNRLDSRRLTILHPLILNWIIPCDEKNFFEKISLEMLASAKIIEIGLPILKGTTKKDEAEDKKVVVPSLQNLFRKVNLEDPRPSDVSGKGVKQEAVV